MNGSRRDNPVRRVDLVKIHLAKKQLGLDDEVYREIVVRISMRAGDPRGSAALLDGRERRALLDEFRRLGWRDQPRDPDAPRAGRIFNSPPARRIWKCWQDLAAEGALDDTSERAMRHFVRGLVGTDHIDWLSANDANRVIEALKAWHTRARGKRAQTQEPTEPTPRL